MRTVKKASIWLMSGLAVIVVLSALSLLLAQKYISREHVKKDILNYLSARIAGKFDFESIDFQFFHRPRVEIRDGSFSIPEEAEGTFETLIVYPRVLPLLTGHVEIDSIEIVKPVIRLTVPETSEPETVEDRDTLTIVRNYISSVLGYFDKQDKGLEAVIRSGSFVLSQPGYEDFTFDGLNVSIGLPDDRLEVNVSGRGSLWDRLSLSVSAVTEAKDIKGSLTVEGLKPQLLSRYLPEALRIIKGGGVNLSVNFATEKLDSLDLRLGASTPGLTLSRNGEDFTVRLKSFSANADLSDGKTSVVLSRAELENPQAVISGTYEMDKPAALGKLFLEGVNVDAGAAREATLLVAGGNRVVDKIFEVVRGGTVPKVTLEAGGPTFREFWREGNFALRGSMVNGSIHIPVAEYDIEDASGDAVIAGGRLEGTNLKGRLGKSLGYDGALVLGFDEEGDLNLDIAVDAEPSEIPPVIMQFVDDERVNHELSLLSNITGKVTGRFRLGDKKKNPEPVIDATDIDITTEYGRFPYPLTIKGGTFSFADKVMTLKGFAVTGGNNSLADVSGVIELEDKDSLDIKTGTASIDLGQIYSWLGEFKGFGPHLKDFGTVTGRAEFPSVSIAGPVSKVTDWIITAKGSMTGVGVDLSGSSEKLMIASADIESSGGRITLSKAVLSHGETSVNLDMVLSDYFTELFSLKMDFDGKVLPPAMEVLTKYVPLPEELVFSGPLSVGSSSLELKGGGGNKKAPDGKGAGLPGPDGGPEWDVDVNVKADSLEWKEAEEATEEPTSPPRPEGEKWKSPVSGSVNIESASFKFKKLNWDSVHAMISFMENGIDIDVSKADLCGISTPGFVNVVPPGVKFEFRPNTADENLEIVIKCLLDKAGIISGDLDLNAVLTSNVGESGFFDTLQGTIDLSSSDGWVEKYGSMARFFAILNFGDLFRGKGPDFGKEGFRYDKLTANADINEGKIKINKAVMDGPSLKVLCEGSVDLVNNKLDLELIVIPVMAVDSVIEKIPLINYIFGSNNVSIPIKITGDLSNPSVSQISPSAIRFGLLGLIKQTLNIPATIILPVKRAENEPKDSDEAPPPSPVANGGNDAMPGLPNNK